MDISCASHRPHQRHKPARGQPNLIRRQQSLGSSQCARGGSMCSMSPLAAGVYGGCFNCACV